MEVEMFTDQLEGFIIIKVDCLVTVIHAEILIKLCILTVIAEHFYVFECVPNCVYV